MGLLQEISDAIGSGKLKQLADGEGNFDTQGSPDQSALWKNVVIRPRGRDAPYSTNAAAGTGTP